MRKINTNIQDTINNLSFDNISNDRKLKLEPLINFIRESRLAKKDIRLNFICTHNSRRSHLSQIWAQTMAFHYGIESTFCYSGGTEATALFPMIAHVLSQTGFEINKLSNEQNPIYSIKFAENELPIIGFSKKMNHNFNPNNDFCAILTCSQADQDCPIVVGASKRIPIPFEDPKAYDGSDVMEEKYHERSLQIATEMKYIFSKITR